MLQDIAPHIYHNQMSWKEPEADDFVLCYRGRTLYCKVEDGSLVLPRVKDVEPSALQYAFSIDERADYLLSDAELKEANGFSYFDTGKLRDMSSFQAKDPSFKQEDMREQVSNLYVQLQNAWTDKDLSPMRPFFSDGLYSQFDRQLDRYRDGHITNKVEGIAVLGVVFEGWYQDDDQDCIALKLSCRITDYTVDDATGEVVKGSPYAEKFMSYRWILSRSSDLSTEKKGSLQTVKCPNCFGVVQINKTAKCPYCDSIITLEEHDWVVTAIQGLSQTTVG